MNSSRKFEATLECLRGGLGWTIVRVPFDVKKAWKERVRLRVRGEINGFAFRTSLFAFREGGHFLLVNKKMQNGARPRVKLGSLAQLRLEPDTAERVARVPAELECFFRQSKALRRFYDSLSYSHRHEIEKWIEAPRQKGSRQNRAGQIAERLMGAMEGERELPPALAVAFARNPKARAGWDLMTKTQRRQELMAMFYYRNPDSRARRIAKTLEMAEQRAERGE